MMKLILGASTTLLAAACVSSAPVERPPAILAELDGTSWVVESVNQRPTNSEDLRIGFDAGKISGNLGCNRLSGEYTIEDDTFRSTITPFTRRLCEPMSFEELGLPLLRGPVAARMEGTRLLLMNPPTSMILRRVR